MDYDKTGKIPMKRILVISYSQSGQLHEILKNFLEPFEGVDVEQVYVQPEKPYVFPWSSAVFFDIMPETVLEEKIPLVDFSLQHDHYDLIVLGYQPWFLSPSLPTTALLQHPTFVKVLNNTPVVTVIGARNMWLNSQQSVVERIQHAGGKLVANIPLIDKNQNLISALTILHWMLTGKKERKWGFLPYPGVAKQDIEGAGTFGQTVLKALENNNYTSLQKELLDQGKIDIHSSILFIEKRAKRLFNIWANLIKRKGTDQKKRNFWVGAYKYYLVIALFIVSPIILTIYNLLIRPFSGKSIQKDKDHFLYLGINQS